MTADGELRRVDAENDPDLFWALRGGGGSFGVVTAIEYDLVELPEVFAGSAIYEADGRTEDIVGSYFEWAPTLPDEMTSIVQFLHPPLPMIPEPLQDRPLITIGACYAGPESDGGALVQPMRELGEQVMDTFQAMPPSGLPAVHMEPGARARTRLRPASRGAPGRDRSVHRFGGAGLGLTAARRRAAPVRRRRGPARRGRRRSVAP